jgi:hypothetical protein
LSFTSNPAASHIGDPDEERHIVNMQEAPDSSQGRYIHRPAVRLPPFWPDRPGLWFATAEAQFDLTSVTSEKTKFNYVISQPEYRHAAEVEDLINSPPANKHYTTLKTELVRRLPASRDQRVRQLLTHEEMGNRKPSQFLRHLKSLAPDVPDDFLRRYGLAGYRPTSRQFWLAKPRANWMSPHNWPTGLRKSPRFPPLHQSPKPPNPVTCSRGLTISPAKWRP